VYHKSALSGITRIRKAFSASRCSAPLSFFMTENIGKIVTVYSRDIVSLSESFVDALHYGVIYIVVILAVCVRMVYEIPFFAIPLVFFLSIGIYVMFRYARKLRATKREFQEADDDVFRAICDAVEGVKVLRTANATAWALDNVTAAFQNWRVATVATDRVTFWLFARIEPLAHLLAFTTCVMSTQLETGKASGVSLSIEGVARRNMVTQALTYLIFFPIAVKRASLAYAGMDSVEKVFRYIEDIPREARDGVALDETWPSAGDFEMKDLSMRYAPSLPNALDNVNLKLSPGSKVGICGRTGCGKSSLFVALFRLFEPHAGSIRLSGHSVLNASLNCLRCRLSIIPQDPVLFGGTLRQNVDPLEM
jgi:ABC-type multidrug transport system fused ATPase/permease subunit